MTKLNSDRRLRTKAVPFDALPWTNSAIGGFGLTDAGTINNGVTTTNVIRCTTPYIGNLVAAHLYLVMSVDSSASVKVAISEFDTDDLTASTPTQEEIDAMHEEITGQSAGLASVGSQLIIDGLTLLPFLPKRDDANFNADGFVLILQFSRPMTAAEIIRRFTVLCSAEIGVS